MKRLIIAVLLILPFTLLSQTVPKKANTIIIKGVSFTDIATALLDANYKINKSDKELGTITTEFRDACKTCAPLVSYYIRVKDSTAIISGTWTNGPNFIFEICNLKSPAHKVTWQAMNDYALSLNKPIEYVIK